MTGGKWVKAAVLSLILSGAAAQAPAAVFSGAASGAGAELRFSPEAIIGFAKKVERTLAAKGARVAIVARVGRPPSELPQGMHYTHAAFAVYSRITARDGHSFPGYAIHNLYQDDSQPDRSSLVQDFPVDFYAGVALLEAGVIIPSPELQERLLKVIGSPSYKALHDPRYSAIANPYNQGRQNCTEFVLDVINAAVYQTDDIAKIKAAERQYFVAQKVNVSPLKLLLGAMFSREVSLSDQPGEPVTATFETLSAWFAKYDHGSVSFTVLPDGEAGIPNKQRLP